MAGCDGSVVYDAQVDQLISCQGCKFVWVVCAVLSLNNFCFEEGQRFLQINLESLGMKGSRKRQEIDRHQQPSVDPILS